MSLCHSVKCVKMCLCVHSCIFVNVCVRVCVLMCAASDWIRRDAVTHPWGLSSWLSGLALCRFRFKNAAYNRYTLDLSNRHCSCLQCSSRLNGAWTCWEYNMSVLNYNMRILGPWGVLYQRQSSLLLPQLAPLLISGLCKCERITAIYLPHPGQCIFSEESFSAADMA